MLKILITGGSGLLALNWACLERETCKVVLALHKRNVNLQGVKSIFASLDSKDDVLSVINTHLPDIVVHTAGLTNVEKCQESKKLAYSINSKIASNVALACNEAGVKLVYISTDHLFSGEVPLLPEDAVPNPVNVYAESKLSGEQKVITHNVNALIIRTNFFGWGHEFRQSFSDWIYTNLKSNKEITLFDDVYFTPILIDTLAEYVHELLALNMTGIFNVVSDERMSKYEFGLLICEKFGLSKQLIKRGSISSIRTLAPRPKDMSLSNNKLKKALGLKSVPIQCQLNQLKNQLKDGRYDEIRKAIRES